MKVLVAGAGAIGQYVGAHLQDAGHDVHLLTTARHVEPLRRLRIEGLSTWSGSLSATTDVNEVPEVQAIVLTCKARLTQVLTPLVAPRLQSDGVFLTLQNGLGNAQKIARFVSAQRIALALTSHGIMLPEPGRLVHAGIGGTQLGPHVPEGSAAADAAQALLADAGLKPERHEQMRGFVWRKALINHCVNPVAALHGVPNGEVLSRPELHAVSNAMLHEGLALASRARVDLPPGDLQELTDATLKRTATNRVSMLQDVEARRPTEIEQLTGRLVRLGEKLLVSMPRSDAVYGRMKDLESSYLGHEAANKLAWDELEWEAEPF